MNAPRPWHRSRLFWLGLPGLLFLFWAWFLLGSACHIRWTRQLGSTQLACAPGALFINHITILPQEPDSKVSITPYPPSAQGIQKDTFPVATADRKYIWPLTYRVQTSFAGAPNCLSRQLTLPFWFLTPLYLIAWLTTLHLWQRRKHRLLENLASTPTP